MERGCVATLPPVSVDQGLRREYNWSRSPTNTMYSYTTEQRSAVVFQHYHPSLLIRVYAASTIGQDPPLVRCTCIPQNNGARLVYAASAIGQDPPLVRCTRKAQNNGARLYVNTIIRHCRSGFTPRVPLAKILH
ncbi:hypothetical protein J6590_056452 [Homalodisca vitripennis]|nr:hypothetical protein J6590_056452 [Homalodisca vitripennis]